MAGRVGRQEGPTQGHGTPHLLGEPSTLTLSAPGGWDPAPWPDLCWTLDVLEAAA